MTGRLFLLDTARSARIEASQCDMHVWCSAWGLGGALAQCFAHVHRFVSCVHLVVGLIVMSAFWATKVVPFEKPDEQFVKDVTLPAFLHAFGHCLTNVSFAAVAVSFTHTIKSARIEPALNTCGCWWAYFVQVSAYEKPTCCASPVSAALEPVFSAIGVFLIGGTVYSLPVYLSLIPIMAGVFPPAPAPQPTALPPPVPGWRCRGFSPRNASGELAFVSVPPTLATSWQQQ